MNFKICETQMRIVGADVRRRTPIAYRPSHAGGSGSGAFTLVEVVIASALVGIMFLAFMGGFSMCFQNVQLDRENSRATQILLEKTELLRLYNWDQVVGNDTNVVIPMTFSSPFYPDTNNGGFIYSGTVTITNAPISEAYSNDMRYVTINLSWTSGNGVQRTRTMSSYVSRYGLQNYIY